jgi:putative transposase
MMSQSNLDPKIFSPRKNLRLSGFDYTKKGHYLVTMDCKNLECRFGYVLKGKMILNEFGIIALEEWLKLPSRFTNFQLNVFQIMPNHIHAIVTLINPADFDSDINSGYKGLAMSSHYVIPESGGDIFTYSETPYLWGFTQAGASPANAEHNSLSDIIGTYKSLVSNLCLEIHKQKHNDKNHVPLLGKIWHRSFWDDIIKDQSAYKAITRYVLNNPRNWTRDKNYKK